MLNSKQHFALKKAIYQHDKDGKSWSEIRRKYSISGNTLKNVYKTVAVAVHLNIDINKVMNDAGYQNNFVTPDNHSRVSTEYKLIFKEDMSMAVEHNKIMNSKTTSTLGVPSELWNTTKVKGEFKPTESPDASSIVEGLITAVASRVEVNREEVVKIVKKEVEPILKKLQENKPVILVVDKDKEVGKLEGTRHPKADTLLKALSTKLVDNTFINVWLSGPAGSGKTFAVKQVAKALGIEYGFHGAMTMAHELVGFVDAGGTYHETVFVRLYRMGGVCLLDECDAGSSEALLALNAALANGQMSLPTGEIIERHPDFRCVAAANTFGHGATADYVGRARIDAAFLDRFGVRISWDYDEKMEQTICGDKNWAEHVQAARKRAVQKGLKVLITPRASITGAALVAGGLSFKEAAELTFLSGLTPEQKKLIS